MSFLVVNLTVVIANVDVLVVRIVIFVVDCVEVGGTVTSNPSSANRFKWKSFCASTKIENNSSIHFNENCTFTDLQTKACIFNVIFIH